MKAFSLRSECVRLEVTKLGGHLGNVTFTFGERELTPMHTAHWAEEELEGETPPVLRVLRGDFFAAPFGDSDVLADGQHTHGLTANGHWVESARVGSRLELTLDGTVMGATVRKVVELRPSESVIYQRHVFDGGSGRLPLGHHAMLRANGVLRLSFAPWQWAGTPPEPVEQLPRGYSALRYPQQISDLRRTTLAGGGETDLTRFPTLKNHEDLWMLVTDRSQEVAWTAATCEQERWVWFSLKNPKVLPETVVWLSHGGRAYPPFSSRHRGVVGLEEVCAYFHLGHAASLAENDLTRLGVPTAIDLTVERPTEIPYIFGLTEIPEGFGAVEELRVGSDEILLVGSRGSSVAVHCDASFLNMGRARLKISSA